MLWIICFRGFCFQVCQSPPAPPTRTHKRSRAHTPAHNHPLSNNLCLCDLEFLSESKDFLWKRFFAGEIIWTLLRWMKANCGSCRPFLANVYFFLPLLPLMFHLLIYSQRDLGTYFFLLRRVRMSVGGLLTTAPNYPKRKHSCTPSKWGFGLPSFPWLFYNLKKQNATKRIEKTRWCVSSFLNENLRRRYNAVFNFFPTHDDFFFRVKYCFDNVSDFPGQAGKQESTPPLKLDPTCHIGHFWVESDPRTAQTQDRLIFVVFWYTFIDFT